ncbi:MAG: DMT family transporter [Actinobacteria bacterium]|nr:DMT family transporter [Actinomycetota bacterium]
MSLTRREVNGLLFAFLGVFLFSLSLPLTKWAMESFDPLFTASARPIIASTIAIPLMIICKVPPVPRRYLRPLLFTTLGGAIGWPVFIALALQRTTAAHVAVIAAIMPLVTAIMAVVRTKKKVSWQFWAASLCGTTLLVIFAISRGGAENGDITADLLTLCAVLASSYCYVEGAELTQVMPGWQVISWVVVFALPVCIPASLIIFATTHDQHEVTGRAMIGLLAIGASSMYLGFFAWYRGLKDAGTAHGSQVQQLQAILTLGWSALMLGEKITLGMVLISLGVVASVLWALGSRARSMAVLNKAPAST